MRKQGYWHQERNLDEIAKQLDVYTRQEARRQEEELRTANLQPRGINPTEDRIAKRIANSTHPSIHNSDIRQKELIAEHKKIRELEDEYVSAWEKEQRKTISRIKEFEEDIMQQTALQKEQQALLRQIADLRK